MSFKKQGQLSKSPERLKHLGDFLTRLFWKRERKAEKELIKDEVTDREKENENLDNQFKELIKTLIALSSPADRQKEIYGEGVAGDDMVEDFNSYYSLIKLQLQDKGLVAEGSVVFLDNLDKLIDEKSKERNFDFWDELEQHGDWEKIRELARLCLTALGKENYGLKVTHENKRDGKGNIIIQFTKKELVKQNDRQH